MKPRLTLFLTLLLLAAVVIVEACTDTAVPAQVELTLAPESELPDFVSQAEPEVKEAYRFAIANPEVLSAFPCYCGCSVIGHKNNLECYIKEVRADGSIEFENHAFGWTICVDITRDVMRLMQEGQELKEIRAYIDAEYSQYGPPTDTEPIQ